MPDRLRFLGVGLAGIAGVVTAVLWWPGVSFVVVMVAYVVAQALTMPTPSRVGISMAPAVAGATALVSHGSPVLVIGAGAAALPLSIAVIHLLHGRRVVDERVPAEPAGVAVFGLLFAVAVVVVPGTHHDSDAPTLFAYLVAAGSGYLATAATRAVFAARGRTPRRLRFIRALADWPAHAILYAVASLYAITFPAMGWWAVLVAGLPYGFGYVSLLRVQATRHTYDQTIRALGRIPEAGGMAAPGHVARTAELAVSIGADLGLGWRALDRIEHAALLHDVGRLVLANPAVAAASHTPSDISAWSAAIIGEAGHLAPIADMVGAMHSPYRRPGERRDPALAREAHVIRVVSSYDEAVTAGGSAVEAMEHLHRGAAYDFDPEIVALLRLTLERDGVL